MKKTSTISKIKYWLQAVISAIRGKEIEFSIRQIEAWFKGKITSQKITTAIYSSDVFMELSNDFDKKQTAKISKG